MKSKHHQVKDEAYVAMATFGGIFAALLFVLFILISLGWIHPIR